MKKQVGIVIIFSIALFLCGCGNKTDINSKPVKMEEVETENSLAVNESAVITTAEKSKESGKEVQDEKNYEIKKQKVEDMVLVSEELDFMVKYKGNVYTISGLDIDIDTDNLVKIGKIKSVVSKEKKPAKNNQANRNIKGALIYQGEGDAIIVKINKEYKILVK